MQAGYRQRAAGLDLAGDAFTIDRPLGFQRDESGLRIGFVFVLDRGLRGAEFGSVHFSLPAIILFDVMGGSADVTTTSLRPLSISDRHPARCGRANGPARSVRGA